MIENFKKHFPVANEGEIRPFFLRRVWYGIQLKYAINDSSHEPVHMSKDENNVWRLYKIFAGIAIFISCLGLYELVSFMAVQRTKETGIRKVLGASALQIVYLFSREFTLLIVLAFLIAAPAAYYFMHGWLENFSFRISPSAGVFLVTLSASVAIAWLTAGYRALRAALANPVKSLRTE